jgi:hypothetical protein
MEERSPNWIVSARFARPAKYSPNLSFSRYSDMDGFVVCSFGRKIFRTRVIRHSLNPVWEERLFFHVRPAETHWFVQLFRLFSLIRA